MTVAELQQQIADVEAEIGRLERARGVAESEREFSKLGSELATLRNRREFLAVRLERAQAAAAEADRAAKAAELGELRESLAVPSVLADLQGLVPAVQGAYQALREALGALITRAQTAEAAAGRAGRLAGELSELGPGAPQAMERARLLVALALREQADEATLLWLAPVGDPLELARQLLGHAPIATTDSRETPISADEQLRAMLDGTFGDLQRRVMAERRERQADDQRRYAELQREGYEAEVARLIEQKVDPRDAQKEAQRLWDYRPPHLHPQATVHHH